MTDAPDNVDILESLREGTLSKDVQQLLARGLVPVEPEILLEALVTLLGGNDESLSRDAAATLNSLPPRILHRYVESPDLKADTLQTLGDHLSSLPVLERILRHRNVPHKTVAKLAARVPDTLQDIIVTNVNRIIDHPDILEALESNPSLDTSVKRRVAEIRRDYFDEGVEEDELFEAPDIEMDAGDEDVDLPEFDDDFEIPQELFDTFGMDGLPEGELFSDLTLSEEELEEVDDETFYQKVLKMTVPQKVELALKGNKEARGILIRDANKLVKAAVVQSPKINEAEVTMITGMKDMPSEVLRVIGQKREYVRKYPIVRNLVYNAHTPVGVSLGLLPRINDSDLKDLTSDKNIPDPLRQAARRLHKVRQTNR